MSVRNAEDQNDLVHALEVDVEAVRAPPGGRRRQPRDHLPARARSPLPDRGAPQGRPGPGADHLRHHAPSRKRQLRGEGRLMRSELLDYYERELSFLRQMGAEFAEKYPKIASRLQLEPDKCEDPARRAPPRGLRAPCGPRPPEDRRRVSRDHRVAPRDSLPRIPRARPVPVDRPVRPRRRAGHPADRSDDSAGIHALLVPRGRTPLPLPDGLPCHDLADRGESGTLRAASGRGDRRPRRADAAPPRAEGDGRHGRSPR